MSAKKEGQVKQKGTAAGWRQPTTVSNRSGYIVKGHGKELPRNEGESLLAAGGSEPAAGTEGV